MEGRIGTLLDAMFPFGIAQITFQFLSLPTFIKASAVVTIDDEPLGFIMEVGMDSEDGSQKAAMAFIDSQGNEKNVLDFPVGRHPRVLHLEDRGRGFAAHRHHSRHRARAAGRIRYVLLCARRH